MTPGTIRRGWPRPPRLHILSHLYSFIHLGPWRIWAVQDLPSSASRLQSSAKRRCGKRRRGGGKGGDGSLDTQTPQPLPSASIGVPARAVEYRSITYINNTTERKLQAAGKCGRMLVVVGVMLLRMCVVVDVLLPGACVSVHVCACMCTCVCVCACATCVFQCVDTRVCARRSPRDS